MTRDVDLTSHSDLTTISNFVTYISTNPDLIMESTLETDIFDDPDLI